MRKKAFHTRSFISFALFISIVWILITGTILYIAPPGRVAHWQFWTFLGLDKDQWQAQHTLFSYLFVVLAAVHLFTLNWRNFWSYVVLKSRKDFRKSREFVMAVLVMALFFAGTTLEIPPFSSFFNLGESVGKTWENKALKGPVPHLENQTLEYIADQYLGKDVREVVKILAKYDIEVKSGSQLLKDIAIENHQAPAEIYFMMSENSQQ